MYLYSRWFVASIVSCLVLGSPSKSGAEEDHFQDHIAPILERRCLGCHNNEQRAGDFSIQNAASAFAAGYIEPHDADASHMIDMITPVAGVALMPKDADPLPAAEIAAIRKWIDEGANWPDDFVLEKYTVKQFDWWSYQPVQRPPVPQVDDSWVRTPIDAFILEKLREKQLTHADEADRRTLIRRLTYDLIGLPPTPDEVDAFLNDSDPQAYEMLVDRLLASDRYGERWARHWLDVVKYADTCGYDKDKLRPNAWPYRDYVIRSFKEDKPYSRFVQEQIAGDVLFPGDPDGILGLGFIAAGPWDFIGHVEVSEAKIDGKVARNLDRDDMVSNAMNTFCSVTVQCARCHNHKFDPITQENYYGMQAIFAAVDRAERPYDASPAVALRRMHLQSQIARGRSQIAELDAVVTTAGGKELKDLVQRVAELRKQDESRVIPPEHGYHSNVEGSPDTEKWVEVDLGREVALQRILLRPCYDDFAGIGAGFGFPVQFRVEAATQDSFADAVVLAREVEDFSNPGLTAYSVEMPVSARYLRVTATKLALRSIGYIFALSELEAFDVNGVNVAAGAEVTALDSIEAPVRWRKANLVDGKYPHSGDPAIQTELAKAEAELAILQSRQTSPQMVDQRTAAEEMLKNAEQKLAELPEPQRVYAAAMHFTSEGNFKPTEGKLRPIHVLNRGNVQTPGDPAVPAVLPFDEKSPWRLDPELNEGERRAALARWLTDKEHPLVWRSIVNRIWQYHFGQGIVATPNDFGRMGAEPTHPELLDWLASEFRDKGQSIKALHRLIVTSSAYRQSSQYNQANAEIDGSNQYLWHMNRRRLEAEEIRDSILTVAGTLDLKMGGPGYYLFQIEKPEHSPQYVYREFNQADPASHRRSIYRFIVRSQPNPWMTTLDCADSSQSTPKRIETLTSLQALTLLNNQFNLEMAQQFAKRLQREASDLPSQVDRAMLLIAQRPPNETERDELAAYAESHGLANLCRFLFNLSEFVYLD